MNALFPAVAACREALTRTEIPGEVRAAFVFPATFIGFAGHFPGSPILPGIAQIMAVIHAVDMDGSLRLQTIKNCKFLRPVLPGERLLVTAKMEKSGEGFGIVASLHVGEERCSTMTLFVTPPEKEF